MTTGRPSTASLDPANRISSPFWILSVCRSRNTDRPPRTLADSRFAYTTAIAHTPTKQQPSSKMPMCAASENLVPVLVESPWVINQKVLSVFTLKTTILLSPKMSKIRNKYEYIFYTRHLLYFIIFVVNYKKCVTFVCINLPNYNKLKYNMTMKAFNDIF